MTLPPLLLSRHAFRAPAGRGEGDAQQARPTHATSPPPSAHRPVPRPPEPPFTILIPAAAPPRRLRRSVGYKPLMLASGTCPPPSGLPPAHPLPYAPPATGEAALSSVMLPPPPPLSPCPSLPPCEPYRPLNHPPAALRGGTRDMLPLQSAVSIRLPPPHLPPPPPAPLPIRPIRPHRSAGAALAVRLGAGVMLRVGGGRRGVRGTRDQVIPLPAVLSYPTRRCLPEGRSLGEMKGRGVTARDEDEGGRRTPSARRGSRRRGVSPLVGKGFPAARWRGPFVRYSGGRVR